MAEAERSFNYLAVDPVGRRVRGAVLATDDTAAFERLRRDGLAPLRIWAGRATGRAESSTRPSDRDLAALLADLAALLQAGADMRASLSILAARSGTGATAALPKLLSDDIGGGEALDVAFTRRMPADHGFIGALVAAGTLSGDLAGGLRRAGEMLEARIRLRDQIVSALSYPAFVFASTLAAVGLIFLSVVPSLAPLVEDAGATPPVILSVLIAISSVLRDNLLWIGAGMALATLTVLFLARAGVLTESFERLVLDGPFRRTAGGLTYGAFAISLGGMLAAGASIVDALALATRSVRNAVARGRLSEVATAVRQGESLSLCLERVEGVPSSIGRMATIGEATGAVGPMLMRAGRLEEDAALRRVEAAGRILGPALIVLLGGMIGLLMAGLLTGVSQLGQAALQ